LKKLLEKLIYKKQGKSEGYGYTQSYNFVQNSRIRTTWYDWIQLVEAHRTIPGRPGFDHFERS